MKLSSITIKNYRALEDITISLNPNMNVIYGVNGVGKSSILYILHDFLNHFQPSKIKGLPVFSKNRVRDISKEASISITTTDRKTTRWYLDKNDNKEKIEGNKNIMIKRISFIPGMTAPLLVQRIEKESVTLGIVTQPKFVYTRGIINFKKLKDDFFNLEFEESKKRIKEYERTGKIDYKNPVLQKIRDAIKKIDPSFGRITIEGEKEDKYLIVEKNGVPLNVEDQLSSGEASLITMIGEICIDAFSEHTDKDIVILIDEVDASLHPQWQMKIGKILKEAFPEVQFIMTSHSPFIWAGLNKNEIIWLDRNDTGKVISKTVNYAKGGSVESIIAEFFGAAQYDSDVVDEIHNIDRLIEKEDADSAREAISKLKEKYGNLPIISQLNFRMRVMGL